MTLYLKYRPQKIEELDLASVREQLEKTVRSGKIPHAFLFAGPRGTGKTSAARILAKIVNCDPPSPRLRKGIEPCNKCGQCVAITRGSSLDVIEIDAASHRGIEDVRALREAVKLLPAGAKMKVYIIDEAHMLTTEAANALLKTLEEPPQHVMFVLATTAPEKLPETIRSRCTQITFNKAKPEEILRSLERAARGEKLKIGQEVLTEVAKNVDGSFREAHKILEQLALERGKVTREDARKLIAQTIVDVRRLLSLLGQKDTKGALSEIDQVTQSGANLRNYTTQVIEKLRQMLLTKLGVGEEVEEITGLESQADIRALIELFSEASRALSTAVIAQLPLELAVVKWCQPEADRPLDDEGEVSESIRSESVAESPSAVPTPPKKKTRASGNLDAQWKEIMQQVKPRNHSIEALLRATRPTEFDGRTLTLEVFYQFHKERLESEPYRRVLEEVAGAVLGAKVRVVCQLAVEKKRAADIVNIQESVSEDIVRAAEEIFGTEGKDANKLTN